MKIKCVEIQNFRKLKSCRVEFGAKETVLVGANNSGKTSAMDALISFLKTGKSSISTTDFTLSKWMRVDAIGQAWLSRKENQPLDVSITPWEPCLPSVDVWIEASEEKVHYVSHIIPTLGWSGGLLGVRLRFEPENIETLHRDFLSASRSAQKTTKSTEEEGKGKSKKLVLWPTSLKDFLDKRLQKHFCIRAYSLDPSKLETPEGDTARIQPLIADAIPLDQDPLKGLIKVDKINAQRGFSDPNTGDGTEASSYSGNLSKQLRGYFAEHLNPSDLPDPDDVVALRAIDEAQSSFDTKLNSSLESALGELETLGYPGFSDPKITLTSKVDPIESLNHSSAVQFDVLKSEGTETGLPSLPRLPEKYNGLGYQNLISMVFRLIRFRDEWMQVGKVGKRKIESGKADSIEPLHLVLIEEPEAHLHAQVQQVFINKAYDVLRNHKHLQEGLQFRTQLVVSTHSSHIAHEIDFANLRYFRRQAALVQGEVPTATVVNLSDVFGEGDKTSKFATRYLKTTHCDLFFADAAILVEGAAERMLVPEFMRRHFPDLTSSYISLLEISGSHAHRLRPLIESLGIITLIVTDLDSVDPAKKRASVLPDRNKGYETGNPTLKNWVPAKETVDDLLGIDDASKALDTAPIRVAFQIPIDVQIDTGTDETIPYTFEDALAFENIELFRTLDQEKGLIKKFCTLLASDKLADVEALETARKEVYNAVGNAKKAEFALDLLFLDDSEQLAVPTYVKEGLDWLTEQVAKKHNEFPVPADNVADGGEQ